MSAKGKRSRGAREVRGSARGRKPLDPSLNVRGEQPYVAVPVRATLRARGKANALAGEVFDWLAGRGVAPAGPLFFRYRTTREGDGPSELEVGVPTPAPLVGDDRVSAGTKPAGAYVTAVHTGHPERLGEAHAELRAWAREQDLPLAVRQADGQEVWEGRFESFLTDPSRQPDPDRWSIEIAYLLDRGPAAGDEERA